MAKNSKSKSSGTKSEESDLTPAIQRIAIHIGIVLIVLSISAVGLFFLKRHVERRLAFTPAPPKIVLKNRPAWMSDAVFDQILRIAKPTGAHSAFDHQMLVDVTAALETNPWVSQVRQVRRVYGQAPADTLEIDCDFHAPLALVKWGDFYSYVDGDGVRLPDQFSENYLKQIILGQDGKVNVRVIEGVKRPPPEAGKKWLGEDLSAGIALVKLLHQKPFAEEIHKISVANFGGRVDPREAQLVLLTRYDTAVRWGQPVDAKGFEVSPAQKLKYMQLVFEQFGQVDGHHPWIDIRFDRITYPSLPENASADLPK